MAYDWFSAESDAQAHDPGHPCHGHEKDIQSQLLPMDGCPRRDAAASAA
jgi:hypothetical protein